MAKTAFSYYIREHIKQPAGTVGWLITKVEGAMGGDDIARNEYFMHQPKSDTFRCDCPAHFHTKRRGFIECKHVGILKRWLKIKASRPAATPNTVIFYNQADDKFYPQLPPLGLDNMDEAELSLEYVMDAQPK